MLVTQHARSARHRVSQQDRHFPHFTDEKASEDTESLSDLLKWAVAPQALGPQNLHSVTPPQHHPSDTEVGGIPRQNPQLCHNYVTLLKPSYW